jgi:hypothetical protein
MFTYGPQKYVGDRVWFWFFEMRLGVLATVGWCKGEVLVFQCFKGENNNRSSGKLNLKAKN